MVDDDRGGTAARTAAARGGPGAAGLLDAVVRVQRELAAYPPALPDRAVAEDELDALAQQAVTAGPREPLDTERLRHSLLLVAAALGSVSALADPLAELRLAVEETLALRAS
ncbi:DUF5955 family protein [Streptomyces sp. NPDC051976]|uniref:DUF5955 family protein n=1 Tax=Streptomyces sp. NPDC051976 TaxID=3154947 RepID=UPI0034146E21